MESRIRKVHEQLQTGQISCEALTKRYLEAAKADENGINGYICVTEEVALEAARAVDEKIQKGETIGLLEGIPMALKDNMSTDGIETTCGSKILEGYNPIYDATVWKALKAQGAILIGKTNMDEFAMGSSSETSYFGGTKNPYNTGRVAGGSSGGSAGVVAANQAVYALGSDTGGSIRQPASFCGLVGMKPTYGAVSRFGLIAYASSLDQIGPFTHTVEDTAILFDAISDKDEMDSTSQGRREETVSGLTDSIAGKKIGIVKEYFEGITGDVKTAMDKAIETYREMGAEIVELELPILKYALPVYYIIACAEATSNLSRYDGVRYGYRTEDYRNVEEMISKTRSEGFGAEVKRRILLGNYVLSSGYFDAYYKKAQSLRGNIIKAFDRLFGQCDVLLTPTVPMTAFPLEFTGKDPVQTYLTDICTVPVNICGLPAMSVPCGFDSEGMPIGMQLIANRFAEKTMLNVAYQYEQQVGDSAFQVLQQGVQL